MFVVKHRRVAVGGRTKLHRPALRQFQGAQPPRPSNTADTGDYILYVLPRIVRKIARLGQFTSTVPLHSIWGRGRTGTPHETPLVDVQYSLQSYTKASRSFAYLATLGETPPILGTGTSKGGGTGHRMRNKRIAGSLQFLG